MQKLSDMLERIDVERGRNSIARRSVGDDVYEALLSELISLRIPPGERMSVDALARDYGVSQTPVRAALIRLESEGLVVKKHNSGYSAAPMPSGDRFRDVYAMRLLVEPEATFLATSRIEEASARELNVLCKEMEALVAGDTQSNYSRFAILDSQFHALIAENCGNEIIVETLERLYSHLNLFRLRYHSAVAEEAVKEHFAIMDAMNNRDAGAARNAMAAHIESSRLRMEPFYKNIS